MNWEHTHTLSIRDAHGRRRFRRLMACESDDIVGLYSRAEWDACDGPYYSLEDGCLAGHGDRYALAGCEWRLIDKTAATEGR